MPDGHSCLTANVLGRDSDFRYTQKLPGDIGISSTEVRTIFSFLGVPPPDPNCETAFRHIVCLTTSPVCNNATDLLLPICEDSCSAFKRLMNDGTCDSIIQSAEQLLMSADLVSDYQIFFTYLAALDCRNVSSYYYTYGNDSLLEPKMCTNILTPNQTG